MHSNCQPADSNHCDSSSGRLLHSFCSPNLVPCAESESESEWLLQLFESESVSNTNEQPECLLWILLES